MPTHSILPPEAAWCRVAASAPQVPTALWPLLDRAAETSAAATAFVGTTEHLTYAELRARVLAVAHAIVAATPQGAPVATLMPHSPTGIVAILGCLVAGRLCVPLNIADPAERISMILKEAIPALLLATPDAPTPADIPTIDPATVAPAPPSWQPPIPDPDFPATVHFTSGSSGRPKGIVLSHHAVLYRAVQCVDQWRLMPHDRVMATTGPNIGSGLSFVVATLIGGAAMAVASLSAEGAGAIIRLAERARVSVLVAPSAILRMLLALPAAPAALAQLRHMRAGAMALAAVDVHSFRPRLPPGCEISHTYASTEAMVIAQWTIPPGAENNAPIIAAGFANAGQDFALLDPDNRPVAPGEVGELVVRGRHIALGEWQAGRMVPGRMVADPAHRDQRIFRTGDLVRRDADDMFRVAGRADRQIKVHGMRIEPAEIEAVLRADPAVREAAVVPAGEARLRAFVVAPEAGTDATAQTLRRALLARLRAALPPTMRPSRIDILPAMPLLATGKTDLQALARLARQD